MRNLPTFKLIVLRIFFRICVLPLLLIVKTYFSIHYYRDVAMLSGKGVSIVQRVKRLLKVQSPQYNY